MELEQAAALGRRHLNDCGLGCYNLIFYDLANPLGFTYRNTIALSTFMCALCPPEAIEETICHEISHALSRETGHGDEWCQVMRLQFGQEMDEVMDLGTGFYGLIWRNELDPALHRASETFLANMCQALDRWIDNGARGMTDYSMFRDGHTKW